MRSIQPLSSDTTPVRFTVELGDPPALIAQNLAAAGLISDANLFVDYVRAYDIDVQLEAGTYFLKQSQSIKQIAATLTDSSNSQIVFSIIPGWRIEEVAAAIDANPLFAFSGDDFLRVVGAGAPVDAAFAQRVGLPVNASLEGFLFPNTYSLPPDVTPQMLRDTLLDEFSKETDDGGHRQRRRAPEYEHLRGRHAGVDCPARSRPRRRGREDRRGLRQPAQSGHEARRRPDRPVWAGSSRRLVGADHPV